MSVPSPRNPILPARGLYADLAANLGALSEGEIVYALDRDRLYLKEGGVLVGTRAEVPLTWIFVANKSDLPAASGGVITLLDNYTYYFTGTVDLTGDRLVCGNNTVILGSSSENCRIKSTGLTDTPLISSSYSLPIRNISIEADLALHLDATGNSTAALDWFGVNFVDCNQIGLIKGYSNFIMLDSAFLNSAELIFDGTIGTVGFNQCLLSGAVSSLDVVKFAGSCVITRRARFNLCSFVNVGGGFALNVVDGATIPNESLLVDTCSFSGPGTKLGGVAADYSRNELLYSHNKGINNTFVNGQMYMQGNSTATVVSATNTFYKVAGITLPSADNSKYAHTSNRLTNQAAIARKYLIQASVSFSTSSGNICEFGFYDSKLGSVRVPSRTRATANTGGKAEDISFFCVVEHSLGDYIEVHVANTSSTQNVTVDNLNLTITQIA
jgi:hypothetical protein